jgi:ATP-dependent DNA helicase RecG
LSVILLSATLVTKIRNPVLTSYATKILPYRGLGSGIIRALKAYPDIEFEYDRDGNQFKVSIQRGVFEQG